MIISKDNITMFSKADSTSVIFDVNNSGNTTVAGTLGVNGNTLSTTQTGTFNLLNTNATRVDFAGAATTVNIGTGAGTVNIVGNLGGATDTDLAAIDINASAGADKVVENRKTTRWKTTFYFENGIIELVVKKSLKLIADHKTLEYKTDNHLEENYNFYQQIVQVMNYINNNSQLNIGFEEGKESLRILDKLYVANQMNKQ